PAIGRDALRRYRTGRIISVCRSTPSGSLCCSIHRVSRRLPVWRRATAMPTRQCTQAIWIACASNARDADRKGEAMTQPNGGFGRRGIQPAQEASRPVSAPSGGGGGIPRLVKQIGGMALGFALVFAVGYISDRMMKQAGKSLDRN